MFFFGQYSQTNNFLVFVVDKLSVRQGWAWYAKVSVAFHYTDTMMTSEGRSSVQLWRVLWSAAVVCTAMSLGGTPLATATAVPSGSTAIPDAIHITIYHSAPVCAGPGVTDRDTGDLMGDLYVSARRLTRHRHTQ